MNSTDSIEAIKNEVDLLNKKAWEVRVNDLPKLYESSTKSIELTKSIHSPKAHGGELKVETKEGEYASFKIVLSV